MHDPVQGAPTHNASSIMFQKQKQLEGSCLQAKQSRASLEKMLKYIKTPQCEQSELLANTLAP